MITDFNEKKKQSFPLNAKYTKFILFCSCRTIKSLFFKLLAESFSFFVKLALILKLIRIYENIDSVFITQYLVSLLISGRNKEFFSDEIDMKNLINFIPDLLALRYSSEFTTRSSIIKTNCEPPHLHFASFV